jgi:hypothetical protein
MEQVADSSLLTKYEERDGKPVLMREFGSNSDVSINPGHVPSLLVPETAAA